MFGDAGYSSNQFWRLIKRQYRAEPIIKTNPAHKKALFPETPEWKPPPNVIFIRADSELFFKFTPLILFLNYLYYTILNNIDFVNKFERLKLEKK